MAFQTISYSETSDGFPSFYSYNPEWMIGMNNYFYSFSGGDIWRHNSDNVDRCNFYGSQYFFNIISVFNMAPLEAKIFKTITLESNVPMSILGSTDIGNEQNITINSDQFVQKEGSFFAYIRYTNPAVPVITTVYPLRYVNGIGVTDITITGPANASEVEYPLGVEIDSILSIGDAVTQVGDALYWSLNPNALPADNALTRMGVVTGINRALRQITVDASCGGNCQIPALARGGNEALFVYINNRIAESYGALGHYMYVSATATVTTAAELFAIKSQVMKSNPPKAQ